MKPLVMLISALFLYFLLLTSTYSTQHLGSVIFSTASVMVVLLRLGILVQKSETVNIIHEIGFSSAISC